MQLTPLLLLVIVVSDSMAQLIGTDLLETAVAATIATGRVANTDNGPLSLLLIAPPESGKTSVVSRDCKGTLSFSDITSTGIQKASQGNPEVSHLIILDMVAIMSHKESTNHLTMSALNAMTEEGIGTIATPGGVDKFQYGKRGLIACLTLEMAKDGRNWWNKTGFASRLLPLCFQHSAQLILKIKGTITYGKSSGRPKPDELILPEKPVHIPLPVEIGEQIQFMADLKSQQFGEVGYRRLKQFRALAQGHALLRNAKTVGHREIAFIKALMPYISFDKPFSI